MTGKKINLIKQLNIRNQETFIDIIEEINEYIKFLAETGCTGFDCSKKILETVRDWGKKKKNIYELQKRPLTLQPASEFPNGYEKEKKLVNSRESASPGRLNLQTLEMIRKDLGNCRRCGLFRERKYIVFGEGDPKARLIFVGEGPGYNEDKQGRPFVGNAGQLFTKIIEAINLRRDKVYICNIIKCRPPDNRNPGPDEIKSCFPFLQRQIAAIKPDFICALGTFAAQTLLNTKESISHLRGHFHDYNGIKVLATYHPAYLLRYTEKKRDVWEDMKKLKKEYGL